MKKILVPAAVVLMATSAAFATKAAKSNSLTPEAGYRIDAVSGACIDVKQQCNTSGVDQCTWSADDETPLYRLEGTMCGNELFKP